MQTTKEVAVEIKRILTEAIVQSDALLYDVAQHTRKGAVRKSQPEDVDAVCDILTGIEELVQKL